MILLTHNTNKFIITLYLRQHRLLAAIDSPIVMQIECACDMFCICATRVQFVPRECVTTNIISGRARQKPPLSKTVPFTCDVFAVRKCMCLNVMLACEC